MAVQFPNFLGVPVRRPDYSAIGDSVENYYKGRAMPKDDLIKAVQAQFAQPNAEQALLSSKLSNRKSQLDIDKLVAELKQQKEFEDKFKQALMGGAGSTQQMPQGQPMPQQMPPMQPQGQGAISPEMMQAVAQQLRSTPAQGQPSGMPPMSYTTDITDDDGIDRTKMAARYRKFDQMATGLPDSAYKGGSGASSPQVAQAPISAPQEAQKADQPNEIELNKGDPHLTGIDMMYENDPRARPYLEKKGYKKEIKRESDKKSGAEIIYTKYPSGRITKQIIMPAPKAEDMDQGIPLTKPVLNKVVNQIRGADAVLPYIDKIIAMSENDELPNTKWFPTDAQANYKATVSEALEKYMASTGLNSTDLATKKTEEILERHFNESTDNYIKRLKAKKIEMAKDRKSNVSMVTKGLKKLGNLDEENSGNANQYSSDEYEVAQ